MHPLNEYTGPLIERAFGSLIAMGVLAVVYGGIDIGSHAIKHPLVNTLHITGAAATHDAIIWGPTANEQASNKANHTPVVDKPISSELGCVSPVIVVPGKWSDSDIKFQAEHIASMVSISPCDFECLSGMHCI
jgi:acyl-CoA reductase-like NAD-dependent aldehyde dehydrogenase